MFNAKGFNRTVVESASYMNLKFKTPKSCTKGPDRLDINMKGGFIFSVRHWHYNSCEMRTVLSAQCWSFMESLMF